MPQIFKALASITAWALWISAWVMGLSTLVEGILYGRLFVPEPPPLADMAAFAIAFGCAVLAVVVMKLRQMLE